MKKLFLTAVSMLFIFIINAQSIGIGTALPNSSSILDINSTTKGVLLPRMNSVQRNALTISEGLTVFDTDTKTYWFHNGANWVQVIPGSLVLPFTATISEPASNSVFKITNSGNGNAISGESTNGTGLYGASTAGNAIAFQGKMKANGSTGTNGGILTVYSDGQPGWQAPVAFCVTGSSNNAVPVGPGLYLDIPFTTKEYDLGNQYDLATHEFTAPVNGIYHFEAYINWSIAVSATTQRAIIIKINNVNKIDMRQIFLDNAGSGYTPQTISADLYLASNDKVKLTAEIPVSNTSNNTFYTTSTRLRFSGRLVIRQ